MPNRKLDVFSGHPKLLVFMTCFAVLNRLLFLTCDHLLHLIEKSTIALLEQLAQPRDRWCVGAALIDHNTLQANLEGRFVTLGDTFTLFLDTVQVCNDVSVEFQGGNLDRLRHWRPGDLLELVLLNFLNLLLNLVPGLMTEQCFLSQFMVFAEVAVVLIAQVLYEETVYSVPFVAEERLAG